MPAQAAPDGVGSITIRNERYRKRFTELLLAVPSRDLPAGWQLAHDLGRPVAPLLWQMLRAEKSNVDRRLVLLAAAVLAGGPGEDARLFAWLAQPKPMLEERVLAGFLMALGPRRTRPVPEFWTACLGPSKTPEQLLAISARLASARFPESDKSAPSTQTSDPGLMAAAAFAGLPLSSVVTARMWRGQVPHAQLFWRGALLGERWRLAADGTKPTLLVRAGELLARTDDQLADTCAAAILLRARAGVLDPSGPRPDWRLLQLAASQPESRTALRQWLQAGPLPRDQQQPERLAVAFALLQPVSKVVEARSIWAQEVRIRRQLSLALALRLAASPPPQPITARLSNIPEWSLVVWASGGPFEAPAEWQDARLAQLAELVAAGRASRAVVRHALEETLWRWGCHPGASPWEQERLLIRDLLLSGSNRGGGKYMPHLRDDQRYFPGGMDRNDPFFAITLDLYEFLARPLSPLPLEYRLR